MASKEPGRRILLFTDIDGTLIAHDTHDLGPAAGALAELQKAGIPVVLCSAKTRAEQEALRTRLNLDAPYVVENGAAIIFPASFAGSRVGEGEQELVVFGLTYREVREGLEQAAAEARVPVKGFGSLSVEEVSELTGLRLSRATRARNREFTETFVIEDPSPEREAALAERLEARRMVMLRGARYWTALGRHDEGRAVGYVIGRYEELGPVRSFGVGDFANDLDMLAAVDVPMLVQQSDGSWADLDLPNLIKLTGIGPEGWPGAARVALRG